MTSILTESVKRLYEYWGDNIEGPIDPPDPGIDEDDFFSHQDTMEVPFDQYIDVEENNLFYSEEFEDKNDEWYREHYDDQFEDIEYGVEVFETSDIDFDEILNVFEKNNIIPNTPGTYHVVGVIDVPYTIDDLYNEYDKYGDSELITDYIDITVHWDKTIINDKYIKIEKVK